MALTRTRRTTRYTEPGPGEILAGFDVGRCRDAEVAIDNLSFSLAERHHPTLQSRTSECMVKHWLLCSVSSLFVLSQALMGQKDSASSGSWSGVIVNSDCTADEGFAESAKCTETRGRTAKLSLYDDTLRVVYALAPQDQAVGHLGDVVTVESTLRNNTIQVVSVKKLAQIGLEVGQKAPGSRFAISSAAKKISSPSKGQEVSSSFRSFGRLVTLL